MNLPTVFKRIFSNHAFATTEDIRDVFGDYHNALHWFAVFLLRDERLADACIVDAPTIAERRSLTFHEWLVHWAARATVRSALRMQRTELAERVAEYETGDRVTPEHPPLSAEHFRLLIENSDEIQDRLDIVCRFVLVLRGVAKDSCEKVAVQLGISRSAVAAAYAVAFETLDSLRARAMQTGWPGENGESTLARSTT